MLLPTMTPVEILNHLRSEMYSLESRISNIVDDNSYRRKMAKLNTTDCYYFKPVQIKSKNKTEFTIIVFAPHGKKSKRSAFVTYMTLACQMTKGGMNFYEIHKNMFGIFISVYTSHFMKRYVERMNLDMNPNAMETFIHFCKTNRDKTTCTQEQIANSKYQHEGDVALACSEGIIFGERMMNMQIEIYKTFVSNEMLKGNQITEKGKKNEKLSKVSKMTVKETDKTLFNVIETVFGMIMKEQQKSFFSK